MPQRLIKLTTRVQIAARAWTDRRVSALRTKHEAGQTSFEYLGIAIVIAAIIGVLATTEIGSVIKSKIISAIDKIFSGNGK